MIISPIFFLKSSCHKNCRCNRETTCCHCVYCSCSALFQKSLQQYQNRHNTHKKQHQNTSFICALPTCPLFSLYSYIIIKLFIVLVYKKKWASGQKMIFPKFLLPKSPIMPFFGQNKAVFGKSTKFSLPTFIFKSGLLTRKSGLFRPYKGPLYSPVLPKI